VDGINRNYWIFSPEFCNSPFSKDNLPFIGETLVLKACKEQGEVSALLINPEKGEIVGYCMGSGEIKILEITTSKELESYPLGIDGHEVEISSDGSTIVGATIARDSSLLDPFWLGELIGGVYIWKINDMNHPLCVDWCEPGDEEYYGFSRGISVSKNGDQVIEFDSSSYILFDVETQSRRDVLLSHDADFHVSVGGITFHPSGKKYAVSFLENDRLIKGDVQIFRFSGPFTGIPNVISRNSDNEPAYVKSLEFSPDGKWLANITDKGVNIWQVLWGRSRSISTINNPQNLIFDANSEILFIQAENSIVVYDFRKGNIVSEINTPGITTITVSSGNEYLAWGDKDGKIHLWSNQ
jgi:WD40 repeat protein